MAKDLEATVKYRYDPKFETGGTFGVNYATIGGRVLAFNYRTIYMQEAERLDLHEKFIVNHYLRQFNEETIATKQNHHCGEPCPAVCKKTRDEFKKDYEPYQTMGPLCGIFDQRAAERLNHHADMYGFDGISAGGVLSWLLDCLDQGLVEPEELGVSRQAGFLAVGVPCRVRLDAQCRAWHGAVGLHHPETRPSRPCRRGPKGRSTLGAGKRKTGARCVCFPAFCPQGVDGSEPVLDARGNLADGDHGQVLHVLRGRFRATPLSGAVQC